MKKIIALLALSTYMFAGVLTSLSGWNAETRKPDAFYTIDTAGENIRVYEFTPKTLPNHTCVIVFVESDKKSPPMNCVEKRNYK